MSSQNAWIKFQKFSGGGGGSDEVSHGQTFSWIRPCLVCVNNEIQNEQTINETYQTEHLLN